GEKGLSTPSRQNARLQATLHKPDQSVISIAAATEPMGNAEHGQLEEETLLI
ncbi:hypothetical protein NPIL_457911, partial [Nephila pilipes]